MIAVAIGWENPTIGLLMTRGFRHKLAQTLTTSRPDLGVYDLLMYILIKTIRMVSKLGCAP